MGRDGRPVSPISHTIRPTFGRGVGLFFSNSLPKNRFYLHPSTGGKACVNTLKYNVTNNRLYPNHRAFFYWASIKKTSLPSGTMWAVNPLDPSNTVFTRNPPHALRHLQPPHQHPQFVNPMIVLWGIKAFCVSCFKAKVTDVIMDGVESFDIRHFDRWMEQQKKTPNKVSQLKQPIGLMPVQ